MGYEGLYETLYEGREGKKSLFAQLYHEMIAAPEERDVETLFFLYADILDGLLQDSYGGEIDLVYRQAKPWIDCLEGNFDVSTAAFAALALLKRALGVNAD